MFSDFKLQDFVKEYSSSFIMEKHVFIQYIFPINKTHFDIYFLHIKLKYTLLRK